MNTWVKRITVALEKAKDKLCDAPFYMNTEATAITATEVALANELWDELSVLGSSWHTYFRPDTDFREGVINNMFEEASPSLCAFIEKVEAL